MCGSKCCNHENISLKHEEPDKFDRSQWCPDGKVSTWYMIYRSFVALVFVGGISGHIANSKQGAKWLIYMTDQGIAFLGMHYLLEACIVVARWSWEKARSSSNPISNYHSEPSLPYIYKISWALHSTFFTLALFISVVYWGVLHKYVVEAHLLRNTAAVVLNAFLHAVNTAVCLIDIWISGRPWKSFHFIYAILFGLYYAAFSLIYWGAGGTGICYVEREGHLTPANQLVEHNGQWCDPFIYPILDWANHPGIAVGMLFGGCIIFPLLHLFWLGISRLREWIFYRIYDRRKVEPEDHHIQD